MCQLGNPVPPRAVCGNERNLQRFNQIRRGRSPCQTVEDELPLLGPETVQPATGRENRHDVYSHCTRCEPIPCGGWYKTHEIAEILNDSARALAVEIEDRAAEPREGGVSEHVRAR